jgi:hypothetical protein
MFVFYKGHRLNCGSTSGINVLQKRLLREKTIEEKGKQSGVSTLATAGSPTPALPNPENGDKEAKGEKSANNGDKDGKTVVT